MERDGLWFIRHKPRSDELLSSWIVRLAHAQGLKLESFCYRSWGRGAQVMIGDVDVYPSSDVIEMLASHTGASIDQVHGTAFPMLRGTLFDVLPANGLTPWITYLGNRKCAWPIRGLSYCPLCLQEDESSYCRRTWRTAFATVCVTHGIRLQQNCPHCGAPFSIHRWDKGTNDKFPGHPITHCPICRKDRKTGGPIEVVGDAALLEFQWILERALQRGWVNVGGRPVDALLFFSGLAILAGILLDRRRSDRLRNELRKRDFLELLCQRNTKNARYECLDLRSRHEIMQVLAWLFQDWPARLIEVCRTARFSSSYLFDQAAGHVGDIPFWLWAPVYLNLNRKCYAPTDAEIDEIVAYIKRHGMRLQKIDVVRLLGVSWLNKATMRRLSREFLTEV